MPTAATPTLTSVPQNFSSNNRSVGFNSNLQQPYYQTVAYSTPPLPPIGTGVPYGSVPDACFNGSPQQMYHAQTSLSELPPRSYGASMPQASSPQPTENFKDQLANILNLAWNLRVEHVHIKNPTLNISTQHLILVGLEFQILLSSQEKMVDQPLSM